MLSFRLKKQTSKNVADTTFKDKNSKNVSHLKVTELVWIHCNIVNNNYQQDSSALYPFVPNKSFGQLLDISPKHLIFLKTFDSEFSYSEVWFMVYLYMVYCSR